MKNYKWRKLKKELKYFILINNHMIHDKRKSIQFVTKSTSSFFSKETIHRNFLVSWKGWVHVTAVGVSLALQDVWLHISGLKLPLTRKLSLFLYNFISCLRTGGKCGKNVFMGGFHGGKQRPEDQSEPSWFSRIGSGTQTEEFMLWESNKILESTEKISIRELRRPATITVKLLIAQA